MKKAKTKQELIVALERIKGAMPNLESTAEEAESCVQEGLIKDYRIKLTYTSLKLVVYGEDFARFVIWDRLRRETSYHAIATKEL